MGVISSIYTAGDSTLATSYDVEVYEVADITKALFGKFPTLYNWQQEQLRWNAASDGQIRTYLGDIRRTYGDKAKQARQAVNLDVQGSSSLIGTFGFNNIIDKAKGKFRLDPAAMIHDAVVAYTYADNIELLYDHYHEHFLEFVEEKTTFYLPFDIELACNYFDKIVLSRGSLPRHYNVSGTHRSIHDVLERCYRAGKRFIFHVKDSEGNPVDFNLESVAKLINAGHSLHYQYYKARGQYSYDRDFSGGSYDIEFID